MRGKARLQHFIENLLQRVDLAERQLEYYQNQQMVCNHTDVNDHMVSQQSPSFHCHPPPGARVGVGIWVGSLAQANCCCRQICLCEMFLYVCFICVLNCHFTWGKGAESIRAAIAKNGKGRAESNEIFERYLNLFPALAIAAVAFAVNTSFNVLAVFLGCLKIFRKDIDLCRWYISLLANHLTCSSYLSWDS